MGEISIPHIINYCWFGGNKLSGKEKKCISSWKKYFPNYEIKEWNETNFDVNCCSYVQEAYKAKKWAFVSDYARFWILYHEGGLYFDTDVEIVRDMSPIIQKGAFMGCETSDKCAPGLGMGVLPGLGMCKEILDYYEKLHFTNKNQQETVVEYTTRILRKHGWRGDESIENVCGVNIYPPEYFCPMNYKTGKLNITENTYTIHWYTASWQSAYEKFKTKIQHIIGEKATEKIIKIKKKYR